MCATGREIVCKKDSEDIALVFRVLHHLVDHLLSTEEVDTGHVVCVGSSTEVGFSVESETGARGLDKANILATAAIANSDVAYVSFLYGCSTCVDSPLGWEVPFRFLDLENLAVGDSVGRRGVEGCSGRVDAPTAKSVFKTLRADETLDLRQVCLRRCKAKE